MTVPTSEGVTLEFDGGFQLMCRLSRPTAKEKNAFKSGVAQFDLAVVDGVIFFLSRFGTMNWMDSPFNIHLYPDQRARLLEVPDPTQGYGIHIMLVDSSTGIVVHQRLIGLDHDLSMRLRDAIINQLVIPDYHQRLQSIMARYSTRDLVALASSHPVSQEQCGMGESISQFPTSHGESVGADEKCQEPCFNHFTINTGHNLVQTKEFFPNDPMVNAELRKLAQESLTPEGAWVIGNITFKAVKESDCYAGTLFSNIGKDKIPLLTTFGAMTEEAGKRIWEEIPKWFPHNKATIAMGHRRHSAPFVVDLFHDCCWPDMEAVRFFWSGMSGDFCKCMGWVFLFPEFLAS